MTAGLHPPSTDPPDEPDQSDESDEPVNLDDVDGRTMRRRRNRARVIEALVELVREGDLNPTVAKIAERSEVSHRSIFRYFEDLDDLARTALETEFANTLPDLVVPDVGVGPLDERIARLVDTRLPVYRRTHNAFLVARSKTLVIPEIGRHLAMAADMQRQLVRRHFAPELAAITERGGSAESVALGAAIIVSFDAYDQLGRFDQLSDEEIRTTWFGALHELLSVD